MCLTRLKHDLKSPRIKTPGSHPLSECKHSSGCRDTPALPPALSFGCDSACPALAVPEGQEPGWGVENSVPSMETPPGTASLPGEGGENLSGGTVAPWRGCHCPLPTAELNGGSVSSAPSAGRFPPAPGSAALGSAPPFQTQARYCELGEPSAGTGSWKRCRLRGMEDGGDPRPGAERVLPRIHPAGKGVFSLWPLHRLQQRGLGVRGA